MAKPTFQLQFLFTDIDHKKQRARELKATIQAEFEAAPEWKIITDAKNKAKDKIAEMKNRLLQTVGGDQEELRVLAKELREEKGRFRDQALPMLIDGKKIEVTGEDKRVYIATLDVKLVPKEVMDEQEEARIRAEMDVDAKPRRTKKLKVGAEA